ncbi:MAG: 8-oxoguanine DNA glycosylase, partial [Candidatus Ranarchaeia archaeon]
LADEVRGLGLKEASHFLRNIGKGDKLAILDRHVLRNLNVLGVISDIPRSITKRRYHAIEKKMAMFASEIGIPIQHLDLLFWFNETEYILK